MARLFGDFCPMTLIFVPRLVQENFRHQKTLPLGNMPQKYVGRSLVIQNQNYHNILSPNSKYCLTVRCKRSVGVPLTFFYQPARGTAYETLRTPALGVMLINSGLNEDRTSVREDCPRRGPPPSP